jgi:hypothetical protein
MKTRSIGDLLADTTLTEPPPVLDGVFGLGEVLVIGGPPKAMKSWSAMSMGLNIASGSPWLDFKVPRPYKVVYFSAEGSRRLRARFQTPSDSWTSTRGSRPIPLHLHVGR